jgi:hypothetical protein
MGILEVMPLWLCVFLVVLAIWDAVWKLIGLWKSARNNHLAWFICIAIFNTLGILPIIYLLMHKRDSSN